MTIPVEVALLEAAIKEQGTAGYLLTVGPDGRPHTVGVALSWNDDLLVAAPGNSTRANATARPLVALLWPPASPGGYSLIADAEVVEASGSGKGDNRVVLRPTKAVLHRPVAGGPETGADGCGSDCVPVYAPAARESSEG
jgi:hypothetical protein